MLEEAVGGAARVGVFCYGQKNEYQRRATRTNGKSRCEQLVCGVDYARTLQSNGHSLETILTENMWKHSASNNNSVLTEKETP